MPEDDEDSGFKLDINFPWEDVLSDGLRLIGDLVKDRPPREKQYMSFWWTHDLWNLRKTMMDESSAGPEPVFEDFAPAVVLPGPGEVTRAVIRETPRALRDAGVGEDG